LKGNWSTGDFIASYIGIPIFIMPIIVWKLWHKTKVSTYLSLQAEFANTT
jgi:amino acid transporter